MIRGIWLVSGLHSEAATPAWIAVECDDPIKATWLSEQILLENVESYAEGTRFFVPVAESFTLEGEIKNVVTVVAKTTHYWFEHMNPTLKQAFLWELRFRMIGDWFRRLSDIFYVRPRNRHAL